MPDERITEPPTLIALVLCDTVIEDARTGKKSLIGIFQNIFVRSLPVRHSSMYIWASLSGGRGKQKFTVRIVDPKGQRLLILTGEADLKDPLGIMDMVFHLDGFPITAMGEYHIDILFGDRPVAHCPFNVVPQTSAPPGPSQSQRPGQGQRGR
jgi:hypothetical protein